MLICIPCFGTYQNCEVGRLWECENREVKLLAYSTFCLVKNIDKILLSYICYSISPHKVH